MTVDEVTSRVAAGLAGTALLGMGVLLLDGVPHHAQSRTVAAVTAPDLTLIEMGEDLDIRAGADLLPPPSDGLAVAPVDIASIEPFIANEPLVGGGESLDSIVTSLGTQVAKSLGPLFMNYSIMMPLAYGPRILQEIPSMLGALSADALPAL